jgi:hypothetical protein
MSEANDDLLRRAARALHDETVTGEDGAAGAPEAWRAMDGWSEIARDVRQAARRRRRLVAAALQLALALGGLGAWAAVSGHLPALFAPRAPAAPPAARPAHARHSGHRAAVALGAPEAPAAEAPAPAEAPRPPIAAVAPAPLAPASARPSLPPAHRMDRARLPERSPAREGSGALESASSDRGTRAAPAPLAAPRVEAWASVDPDVLYRVAHTAQFVRRDYAAALLAWDRYIALGPQSFTPEARYNRAIALVRLQRREEAAAALRPFAAGAYGGYRAEEAKGLLRLLSAPP